jgi:hypothetical protein
MEWEWIWSVWIWKVLKFAIKYQHPHFKSRTFEFYPGCPSSPLLHFQLEHIFFTNVRSNALWLIIVSEWAHLNKRNLWNLFCIVQNERKNKHLICSARDWERSGLLGESPERLFRYLRFSKRATVGVRATYATRWNSGMKWVMCGWTQPLFHKVSNHRFSGRNLKG